MSEKYEGFKVTRLERAYPTEESLDEYRREERERDSAIMPFYGHSLHTRVGMEDVERQMNEAAIEYYMNAPALDVREPERSAAEHRLRGAVVNRALKLFVVKGVGVENGIDDLFNDLLYGTDTKKSLIESFDPMKGRFGDYFRSTYKKRTKTALNKNDERYAKSARYDESERDSDADCRDNASAREFNRRRARLDRDLDEFTAVRDSSDDARNRVEESLVEALVLVIGFLAHRDDGRDNTPERKMYRRVFFAEQMLWMIKRESSEYACEPYRRHENAIFCAMDLPFVDFCLADVCRAVLAIWRTDLKDGFGVIHREDEHWKGAKWKVPNPKVIEFLDAEYGVTVGSSALSAHRKEIRTVFESTEAVRNARARLRPAGAESSG